MIEALYFVFFFIVIFILMVFFLLSLQKTISIECLYNSLKQPTAIKTASKYGLILTFIIEAPFILLAVAFGILGSSIFSKTLVLRNVYYIVLSILSLAITGISTFYFYKKSIKAFIRSVVYHPSFFKDVYNFSIFLFTLAQTPLIFTLVVFFFTFFKIYSDTPLLISDLESGYLYGFCCFACSVASFGVLKGISGIIYTLANTFYYKPYEFKKNTGTSLLNIGLVETPLIFLLVLSFLLTSLNHITGNKMLFILIFSLVFFSIIAACTSAISAKMAQKGIEQSIYIQDHQKKGFLGFAFFSQIILDARVLYLFVVILIIFIKNNVL